MSYKLRFASEDDLPSLVALEQLSFTVPWSERSLRYELQENPFAHLFVAEDTRGLILGYCGYHELPDEAEITNLCVLPDCRGKGIGTALLKALLEDARKRELHRAILEVRISNSPALSLYRRFGFEPIGLRHNYYPDNQEDAIIMAVSL